MTTEQDSGVTTTTYYIGNVEVVSQSNSPVITTRRYLPGAIHILRDNGTEQLRYLLKDHLGSIDTILDERGRLIDKVRYDAWGQKQAIPPHTGQLIRHSLPCTLTI